jgi:hypothetical protein
MRGVVRYQDGETRMELRERLLILDQMFVAAQPDLGTPRRSTIFMTSCRQKVFLEHISPLTLG